MWGFANYIWGPTCNILKAHKLGIVVIDTADNVTFFKAATVCMHGTSMTCAMLLGKQDDVCMTCAREVDDEGGEAPN